MSAPSRSKKRIKLAPVEDSVRITTDVRHDGGPCFKVSDCTETIIDFNALTGGYRTGAAAGLIETFIDVNQNILSDYGIRVIPHPCRDESIKLKVITGDVIGAFPLRSPSTGKFDLGMTIAPRIRWSGLGDVLTAMGWKVIPELKRLPVLPKSEKDVPSWVIASVIVERLEKLLDHPVRKYEEVRECLYFPRGRIDWVDYCVREMPQLKVLDLPCVFSSLRDNRTLMGVMHYTVRKIYGDVAKQLNAGSVVVKLMIRIEQLLRRLADFTPLRPTPRLLQKWVYGVLIPPALDDGLEAMRWSAENTGLGGVHALSGLPWKMSMSAFFEAYVETVVREANRFIGGTVLTGRESQTTIPFDWMTSHKTMTSLKPDVILRRNESVLIVDAKFKPNEWRELRRKTWSEVSELTKATHRADLHQIIAYSSCFKEKDITICLVYPAEQDDYELDVGSHRLHQVANIRAERANIRLIITAVPMRGNVDFVGKEFANCVREAFDEFGDA